MVVEFPSWIHTECASVLAACFVPAWRASRQDAVVALRAQEG